MCNSGGTPPKDMDAGSSGEAGCPKTGCPATVGELDVTVLYYYGSKRPPLDQADVEISGPGGKQKKKTGANGIANFPGLKPGSYNIHVTHGNTTEGSVNGVPVSNKKARATVVVKPMGTLRVRVIDDKSDATLAGSSIVAKSGTVTTDSKGEYQFTRQVSGTYSIKVSKKEYIGKTETVTANFTPGGVVNTDVRLRKLEFSVDIDLPEMGDPDMLTILFPKGKWRDSKVRFDIKIKSNDPSFRADQTEFIITKDGSKVYGEVFTRDKITVGEHQWFWDGFDTSGILDTYRLLGKGLQAEVKVTKDGVTKNAIEKLNNEPEIKDWVDVIVNIPARTVQIKVYIDCQNESKLPDTDFNNLKSLALNGIGRYWSRKINVDGVEYTVTTTATHRVDKSEDFDLYLETKNYYNRSHNTGIIDASIIYNQGFFGGNKAAADDDYRVTSAHEYGHAVLKAIGGTSLSWGHKGTSTTLTQKPLSSSPTYPASGPIDLMIYYNGSQPLDYAVRVVAAEEDVKRLIYLSQIDFDEG
jgi:hypothetical protein